MSFIDYPLTPAVSPIGSILCRQLVGLIPSLQLNQVSYLQDTEEIRIRNSEAYTEPLDPEDPKIPIPAIAALVLAHAGNEFNLYSIGELQTLHYSLQAGDFGAFAGVVDDQFTAAYLPDMSHTVWPPV